MHCVEVCALERSNHSNILLLVSPFAPDTETHEDA